MILSVKFVEFANVIFENIRLTAVKRSFSDAIHAVKPLTKLWRKLIGKSFPILFTHLIFERKQNLNSKKIIVKLQEEIL